MLVKQDKSEAGERNEKPKSRFKAQSSRSGLDNFKFEIGALPLIGCHSRSGEFCGLNRFARPR
jgi:hypothetical protein